MKKPTILNDIALTGIIYGGQAIGKTLEGKKVLVWGGLPDEIVDIQLTKNKSSYSEGIVINVKKASSRRIEPKDPDSFLSTSPWQIIGFELEQQLKSKLIQDAFKLQNIQIDQPEMISDGKTYGYRNKMEYSFWWDEATDKVSLALFRRGSHQKIAIKPSSLADGAINATANKLIDLINQHKIDSRKLKTALIRCTRETDVALQLYVKDEKFVQFSKEDFDKLHIKGLGVIFSNPKSPASVITKKLYSYGDTNLQDNLLGINFNYSSEGFFQVNLDVYELALKEMQKWLDPKLPTLDLYSGVGSIGLTIGTTYLTMVETNESAVREMQKNIKAQNRKNTRVLLSDSEKALEEIKPGINLILDPPRAGCHDDLLQKIKLEKPKNIIYLSCNPVTQARDVAKLLEEYDIAHMRGFNFFPRTPHIENLVVLQMK